MRGGDGAEAAAKQAERFAQEAKAAAEAAKKASKDALRKVQPKTLPMTPKGPPPGAARGPGAPGNPVFRGDVNPTSPLNSKGIPKSYLNEAGDLVPANPTGMYQGREVSAAEHILGGFRRGAKSNSPYTSFTPNGEIAAGYGGQKITVDLTALRRAIQSGEVKGVEIVEQAQLQQMIRNNANLSDYWKNLASKWAARDQEVLIKGVIPKKFIKVE